MRKRYVICVLIVSLLAGACTRKPRASQAEKYTKSKVAFVSLDQGWTENDRWMFWYTSQGSQLIPYNWFLHIEQSGNQTLFRDDAHMDKLRFLNAEISKWNPDGMPIGFVKGSESANGVAYLGFTCAACHTNRLEHAGAVVQVEGGPAMADFESFVAELNDAAQATLAQPDKFERFAASVAGEGKGPKADALRREFEAWAVRFKARVQRNRPPEAPGFARVDALGNILNQVLSADLSIPENAQPPNAPVSYPVIWDAHQHDFVQWNGAAPNAGPGPLLRNVGEVLGVFGSMEFTPGKLGPPIYRTATPEIDNLQKLEVLVAKLYSPQWPAQFPAIDREKVAAGAKIYQRICQGCHPPLNRTDPGRRIKATLLPVSVIGTDPTAATNFVNRKAKTGVLQGTQVFLDPAEKFTDEYAAGMILRNAVFGVQLGKFDLKPERMPANGDHRPLYAQFASKMRDADTAFKAFAKGTPPQLTNPMYKTRPLNGAWASAPYLHNGSVPNLWELLQDADKRVKQFYVGSRQFDPVNVGFSNEPASEGGVNHYLFDTSRPANSNSGHTGPRHGTNLSDIEKRQLIEYLKTL